MILYTSGVDMAVYHDGYDDDDTINGMVIIL